MKLEKAYFAAVISLPGLLDTPIIALPLRGGVESALRKTITKNGIACFDDWQMEGHATQRVVPDIATSPNVKIEASLMVLRVLPGMPFSGVSSLRDYTDDDWSDASGMLAK